MKKQTKSKWKILICLINSEIDKTIDHNFKAQLKEIKEELEIEECMEFARSLMGKRIK
jgi:hypothetical protein